VYDFSFPYLLSGVQLIVPCIHRYREVYFLVYIAGSQNVTPHKLNAELVQLNLQQSFGRWIGYTRTGYPANPPPIHECQFGHSLYITYTVIPVSLAAWKPSWGYCTQGHTILRKMTTQRWCCPKMYRLFKKARHLALYLTSKIHSTQRFLTYTALPN
jgi:hypothetical protein